MLFYMAYERYHCSGKGRQEKQKVVSGLAEIEQSQTTLQNFIRMEKEVAAKENSRRKNRNRSSSQPYYNLKTSMIGKQEQLIN